MHVQVEHLAVPESFEDFCERHDIRMVVKERGKDSRRVAGSRWYASPYSLIEVMDNGFLIAAYGDGDTPEEAVLDFAQRIRGCKLVRDAYSNRYEFQAPSEWEDK